MELRELKRQILNGVFSHLYIFTGEELYVRNVYTHKIAELSNKTYIQHETVGDALKCRTNSLFANPKCFIVYDDAEFLKAETAWDNITNLLGNNILILIYNKLDKRGKFYKHFQDNVVTFEHLDRNLLKIYLNRDTDLSETYCDELIDACESDYSRILLETDKIQVYKEASDVASDDEAFDILLKDKAIYLPPQDVIFEWVGAVLSGKPRKAFALLAECFELGEPSLRLLLVLYTNVKHLLQVQSCPSPNVEKATGLTGWEIRNVEHHQGIYTNGELVKAMRDIKHVEQGIKQGDIDEKDALPYILSIMF